MASLVVSTSKSMLNSSPASALVTGNLRLFSSTSVPSSPQPKPTKRSSRFASRPGADMVGPLDSLSNLRPVKHGSAFQDSPNPSSSADGSSMSITHPYSLSEFNPSSTASASWLGGKKRGHSLYFERLLRKLEEAELAHKLRMARADNFDQRFWQDNNTRFIQALEEFRSRTNSSKAVATLKGGQDATKAAVTNTNQQENEMEIDSDMLATFYSAWLKANAIRHQAYNRQLWSQTFGDLAPAFRYQALRSWAKLVGAAERRLGWE